MKTCNVQAATRGRVIAVACVVLSAAGAASADTIVDCAYDGYVAMGGMVCNTGNAYLLPGSPEWEPQGTMETFGYAFLKFDAGDLPASAVQSATLQLEVISLQDGMTYPVTTPDAIGDVGVFAVTADVAGISAATANAFRANIAETATSVVQLTTPGGDGFFAAGTAVSLDVTDVVNTWINSGNNYGLVLACIDGYILRLHSSDSTIGASPFICVAVPEPGAMSLLICGALSVLTRRSR